ncbi:hypothetical protein F0562_007281 [Nyssa sinensis]|uniref:Alpha/beta hydrolase fold-3 domain-containing protein n=1 Tax=Nyssa sinensis TaxID=561372 RepID=A0A5J5A3H3_9ASTE|nr:hypothetical protein F0562_007281 [Nyssa sinensis]
MSVVAEVPGYIQVFSDGSVKRFLPEIAPASTESSTGFKSKDVIIDPSKPVTARMFLPDNPISVADLPVLVYFHGGGFCIGSTTWLGYHYFLGDLSVASQSIVLSVDYRLAPENRLPIAYDDCYSSIEWLSHKARSDPWLDKADLSRVFLSGDSAGGNIVHQRTEGEMADGAAGDVKMNDLFWSQSLPEGSNRDYYGCNFEMAELSPVEWSQFPAVVVYVAGLDFLKERGAMYAEFLQKKGVKEVKLVEEEGESHIYHVFHPKSEATHLLQKQMSSFIHSF